MNKEEVFKISSNVAPEKAYGLDALWSKYLIEC